jgi:hypothetical protein
MPMRTVCLLLGLWSTLAFAADPPPRTAADAVRDFVAASNRQDVEAMLAATVPEFRWIQVVGDNATSEVIGHSDLKSWLESYFLSTPTARSQVGPIALHGAFASTVETTSWTRKDGSVASQSATSVYEFAPDGRIRFVWYFSAQPAATTP